MLSFFFFKQKTAYEMRISDWSSDVCSSDLEELVEAAAAQMRELPFYNSFFKTATPPTVMLAAKIASLTDNRLPHIFFNTSGSEANDTVFRMVRHYWKLKGAPKHTVLIRRWNTSPGSHVPGVSHGGVKK